MSNVIHHSAANFFAAYFRYGVPASGTTIATYAAAVLAVVGVWNSLHSYVKSKLPRVNNCRVAHNTAVHCRRRRRRCLIRCQTQDVFAIVYLHASSAAVVSVLYTGDCTETSDDIPAKHVVCVRDANYKRLSTYKAVTARDVGPRPLKYTVNLVLSRRKTLFVRVKLVRHYNPMTAAWCAGISYLVRCFCFSSIRFGFFVFFFIRPIDKKLICAVYLRCVCFAVGFVIGVNCTCVAARWCVWNQLL